MLVIAPAARRIAVGQDVDAGRLLDRVDEADAPPWRREVDLALVADRLGDGVDQLLEALATSL